MAESLIIPIESCTNPARVGGKAAGLGRLVRSGFRVPPGLCLSTVAYHQALYAAGLDLATRWAKLNQASELARGPMLEETRRLVASLTVPRAILDALDIELARLERLEIVAKTAGAPGARILWAVRSSASEEDGAGATFGGLYRTTLGVPRHAIAPAIIACWASLWTPAAFAYRGRRARGHAAPAMAVVFQPLLSPRAAGVAYSRHPVTGEANRVVLNAVFGLAEPLVSGRVTPDHYVVEIEGDPASATLRERNIAEKKTMRVANPSGLIDHPVPAADQRTPVLGDSEALALAGLVREVEKMLGMPIDLEWALDSSGIWLLQARPIPDTGPGADLTAATCAWSRANFKETLPELPSPLTLSFLHEFMETHILRHYREIGCRVPRGLSSVRVIRGRPYINVTLFQSLLAQFGGDPHAVTEQMGGEIQPPPPPTRRLAWWRVLRAGFLLERKIRRAAHQAPAWFAKLKRLGKALTDPALDSLTERELLDRLDALNLRLREGDLTFAMASGVSQALYVLGATLGRRVRNWRPLLNAATQGLGAIISAQQILWLVELAAGCRREPHALDFLLNEPWEPEQFRDRLAGTSVLVSLEAFLDEYGHRAIGESDVMSPRFAETPAYVLDIIRGLLQGSSTRSGQDIRREQESARQTALTRIRAAFGWRLHEWTWFRWWHRSLCRYLELREANRHHLMYYTMGCRRLLLLLGGKLAGRGVLERADEIFFLLPEEIDTIVARSAPERAEDWKRLVAARRAERERNAQEAAPDTVIGRATAWGVAGRDAEPGSRTLSGIPLSAGYVEGPVRLVLSPEDTKRVKSGDILVAPVIDPGMAPLLGLAAGLVVEMGGTLSHGAIIAREYGLPAVANVHGATRVLTDGERIAVDAMRGEIIRLDALAASNRSSP